MRGWVLVGVTVLGGCLPARLAGRPPAQVPAPPFSPAVLVAGALASPLPTPLAASPASLAPSPSARPDVHASPGLLLQEGRLVKGDKGAPAELVAGGTVAFTLKVQNTGNVPLSNLAVRVRPEDDGIGLAQDCVGCLTELGLDRPLPPGELVSLGRVGLRADPDLAAGLRFSVVAEGTASGGVRTAERFEFELGALPPELTWTAVESATDVRSLREGSSSFKAIRVRLANAGQSDARNVLAELESDDPGIRVGAFCKPCVADQRVARIDAGGTHLLDQPFGLTAKDGRKGRRNVPLRLILRDGDGRKWRLERETPLTF